MLGKGSSQIPCPLPLPLSPFRNEYSLREDVLQEYQDIRKCADSADFWGDAGLSADHAGEDGCGLVEEEEEEEVGGDEREGTATGSQGTKVVKGRGLVSKKNLTK